MDLRGYEQAKFDLAEVLRSAEALAATDDDALLQDQFRDLFVRLAEDRFNLVVVGRFNRGKSSLMNAIIGMDRLPTGIVPLTSVITTISYGSTEKVTLTYQQRRLDTEIPLRELPQYITQHGNPGNSRGIATANVQLPAEILRRGFYFVDTPGLGSVVTENTRTTHSYLPEADALLLVTSFESPLSEEELGFLRKTAARALPIFIVINKQDLVAETERDEAVAFLRAHLQVLYGDTTPEIFSISARDGLAAKHSGDAYLLDASGLPTLEAAFTTFLLEHKRTAFLSNMCGRVGDLVNDLPPSGKMFALRQQAQTLAEKYGGPYRVGIAQPASGNTTAPFGFSRSQLRSCQICADVDTATWDFLAQYQYKLSIDRDTQAEFAQHSGFCCFHTWEYQELASPSGTCAGFATLLDRLAASLREVAASPHNDHLPTLEDILPTHGTCLVCKLRDQTEARALTELADRLDRNVTATLEELSALCLPHLAALTKAVGQPGVVRALTNHHASTFERVAEDMRRFALKHAAALRSLETKEEQAAAQRAILLMTGRRNVNFAVGARNPRAAQPDKADGTRHE
jgi:small GTP-binding protein